MEDLVGLFAIVLTLMIPIVAIVFSMIKKVSKSKLDNELRLEIVRSGNTSPEVVKELLKTPEKKASDNKIVALRWGCALAGLGLAALVCHLTGLGFGSAYTYAYLILGCGVGLIGAVIVEMVLGKKNEKLPDVKP
ncbi:MAG: hypothetical protein IKD05_05985 [Tidjanibacter sp.]|nr:hypothetical protein [Tidjanibacter sp.]MBR2424903.1 hypothetical protein [Tidjanibacter sp.]MBR3682767.1 hypothetical protein [Tidjanibacter sp.]MBR7129808.1 hypothetical protein [Tidjanibacter sp.]